ncbi:hypothetical protein [Modestobacter caceresii]|uniref:hypothetical protein n=1 Tax=Modestobacter caceresii TaxID=1522368 RepID=UPI002F3F3CD1
MLIAATQRSSAARIGSIASNSASKIGTCPSTRASIGLFSTTAPAVIDTVRSAPLPVARSSSSTRALRSIASPGDQARTTDLCGSSRPT